MDIGNLPTSLRARRQRSGITYFYFSSAPGFKEVALGKNLANALEQYQMLQRQLLLATRPDGLSTLDLLSQFQKCNPRPTDRHADARRAHELKLLRTFFTECGNPTASGIPSLPAYQKWLDQHADTRNFDSVRLFRRIWEFMQRHEYVIGACPWASVPSHSERVTLELADVIYPYSTSELKQLLAQLLDPKVPDGTICHCDTDPVSPRLGSGAPAHLQDQLLQAKRAATLALENSHRNDLLPPLSKLTVRDLTEALISPTRVRHLPPGKIDLTVARKLVIQRLRQERRKEGGDNQQLTVRKDSDEDQQ
ncbi:hypothetical protein PTE30175_02537 [Pandoraea terrae]|uniref:Integrase n=1 Tax=Pandoraea terrae TaxID=1537710 RepID=A0A5E4VEL2_9BURK|nr:hypothetical protein [Pandoraea terrae]VVE10536.1 hypothetical protein PTE30175_02537 [Pandoraea terrae]